MGSLIVKKGRLWFYLLSFVMGVEKDEDEDYPCDESTTN